MRTINSLLLAAILLCAVYALIDGMRCGSLLGILLASGSIGALIICIRLIKRMTRTEEE